MSIYNFEMDYENTVGIVMEVNKYNRKVAVFIPKFMPNIPQTSRYNYEETLPSSIIAGSVVGLERSVKKRNSMWVKALDRREPLPSVGSKVIITFLDKSFNHMFWYPFNPDGTYQSTENENKEALLKMMVSGRNYDIYNGNTIQLIEGGDVSLSIKTTGTNKALTITTKTRKTVSPVMPEEAIDGDTWVNGEDMFIFINGQFERLVRESEIEKVYNVLYTISNKIIFVKDIKSIKTPNDGDIAVVDESRLSDRFVIYKKEDNPSNKHKNGVYYQPAANSIVEFRNGEMKLLDGFIYSDTSDTWYPLDGWIDPLTDLEPISEHTNFGEDVYIENIKFKISDLVDPNEVKVSTYLTLRMYPENSKSIDPSTEKWVLNGWNTDIDAYILDEDGKKVVSNPVIYGEDKQTSFFRVNDIDTGIPFIESGYDGKYYKFEADSYNLIEFELTEDDDMKELFFLPMGDKYVYITPPKNDEEEPKIVHTNFSIKTKFVKKDIYINSEGIIVELTDDDDPDEYTKIENFSVEEIIPLDIEIYEKYSATIGDVVVGYFDTALTEESCYDKNGVWFINGVHTGIPVEYELDDNLKLSEDGYWEYSGTRLEDIIGIPFKISEGEITTLEGETIDSEEYISDGMVTVPEAIDGAYIIDNINIYNNNESAISIKGRVRYKYEEDEE